MPLFLFRPSHCRVQVLKEFIMCFQKPVSLSRSLPEPQSSSDRSARDTGTGMWSYVFALLAICSGAAALENGEVRTPPMGWLSWERFRCITNCNLEPDDCISERLIKEMADKMVSDGYLAAGYEYLIIDDCYLAKERDKNGKLQPDPERFPSGMKNLSDYIHSKGLKVGIYEDYGTKTCAGYPGIIENLELDAKTLVEWGADYVKIDGCYAEPQDMDDGYKELGRYLLKEKSNIVYSCSWPYYQRITGLNPNYTAIAETCNLWRNFDDIQDSWNSVLSIMDHYGEFSYYYGQFSSPGQWNDPDSLIIGNYALSYEQSKAQMAVWSILAAPLIMSHDLRNVRPEFRDILLNKEAIKINQDKLSRMGQIVYKKNSIDVWTKPIEPVKDGSPSYAIAFVNKRTDGSPHWVKLTTKRLKFDVERSYTFTEVFNAAKSFEVPKNGTVCVRIPVSGVLFFKAVVH